MEGMAPHTEYRSNISFPAQNTSSIFTRTEKISLAQGAIDQFIKLGYPAGSIHAAISGFPIDRSCERW
jgi:hypothetical protein